MTAKYNFKKILSLKTLPFITCLLLTACYSEESNNERQTAQASQPSPTITKFKYTDPIIDLGGKINTNKQINVSKVKYECKDIANQLNLKLAKRVFVLEKAAQEKGIEQISIYISNDDQFFKDKNIDISQMKKVENMSDDVYHKYDDTLEIKDLFAIKYELTALEKECLEK